LLYDKTLERPRNSLLLKKLKEPSKLDCLNNSKQHTKHFMSTSPLKEFDYFIAWIIFNSAALIGGAILGAIGGAAIGVVLTVMGVSKEMIVIAGAIVGFILGLPVSYLCFRLIVDKFIVQKIQPPALVKP